MIFLVRHAKAGHRDPASSDAEDALRPLTNGGWAQAKALVDLLLDASAGPPLLSSPYVRCMQTLTPLAERLGVDIGADDRLIDGAPFEPVLGVLSSVPEGAVLCSHGEPLTDVIKALIRRGCRLTTEPNWKKGAVWAIERASDGELISAAAWPPPS
jgi:phosphohistidine phosphatase SixA